MKSAVVAAAGILLALSACTTPSRSALAHCGGRDERPWVVTKELPGSADELRRMAKPGWVRDRFVETWFRLPSGEVMLCRTSPGGTMIDWWQYDLSGDRPRITNSDGVFIHREW